MLEKPSARKARNNPRTHAEGEWAHNKKAAVGEGRGLICADYTKGLGRVKPLGGVLSRSWLT